MKVKWCRLACLGAIRLIDRRVRGRSGLSFAVLFAGGGRLASGSFRAAGSTHRAGNLDRR